MAAGEKDEPNYCLDEEQIRVLHDLEKITRQSVSSMLKEGIELYIKHKKGEVSQPEPLSTMLSPIVFEPR